LHAIYLGGVWIAIAQGLPASISALLAALQPILTAALAPLLLHERIELKQWLGIALGFLGIIVVLSPKLAGIAPGELAAVTIPAGEWRLLDPAGTTLADVDTPEDLARDVKTPAPGRKDGRSA